jgi:hypothetical protein
MVSTTTAVSGDRSRTYGSASPAQLPRHGEVEDRDRRAVIADAVERRRRVADVGHDREVGLRLEQETQRRADHQMVVGEHDRAHRPTVESYRTVKSACCPAR